MRYPLPIVLPNDVLPELLRSARAYGITVEELILTMIEDYLEDCRRNPKSATFGKEPPKSAPGPRGPELLRWAGVGRYLAYCHL